jgi:hypothetical protein
MTVERGGNSLIIEDTSHRGRAWIARITGVDKEHGLTRRFVRRRDVTTARTNVYRRQQWVVPIEEGVVYEFRDIGASSSGGDSGFWRLGSEGELVTVARPEVQAYAEALAEAEQAATPSSGSEGKGNAGG